MTWLVYACISAVSAALTAILAKIGIEGVPSNLATAIRTIVITAFAWAIVAVTGEHRALTSISRRSVVFLVLSGVATGMSWLVYFRSDLKPARISSVSSCGCSHAAKCPPLSSAL